MKRILTLSSLVLLFYNFSFAQGLWTWVSGANVPAQGNPLVAKGVPSLNAPGSRQPAATWVDKNGNFWVFGGEVGPTPGSSDLNDLWKYSPATNEWTWVSGTASFNSPGVYGTKGVASTGNTPGARTASVSWVDKSGNLWLFGGYSGDFYYANAKYWNDLWKFNPVTNEWTWVSGSNIGSQPAVYGTKGVPSTSNTPAGVGRAMGWTDLNGFFWLYGGAKYGYSATGDFWRFNPSTSEWTWMRSSVSGGYPGYGQVFGTKKIPSPSNYPGDRNGAATWVDKNNNLWFYGGIPDIDFMDDLWKYDVSTDQWTWVNGDAVLYGMFPGIYGTQGVAATTNQPGARLAMIGGMTGSDGKLWLFGGEGLGASLIVGSWNLCNDLWNYDPASDMWTWVSGDTKTAVNGIYGTKGVPDAANKPGGRMWSSGWIDATDRIWIFAGSGYEFHSMNNQNDLWRFAIPTQVAVTAVSASDVCAGGSLDITYTATGTFNSGNVFSVQLSDASGSFANPAEIGKIAGTTGGVIKAVFPDVAGSGYRVRVVSSLPVLTSADNGSDIAVFGKMRVDVTGPVLADVCPGADVNISATVSGGRPPIQYKWSNGATGAAITVRPLADLTLNLEVSDNGCNTATNSIPITVTKQQILSIDGNMPLCKDGVVELNAHTGYVDYKWQDGSTDSMLAVKKAGTYSVTVTGSCGQLSAQAVVVDAPALPAVFLPADTSVCSFDNLSVAAPSGFSEYVWSTGDRNLRITIGKPGLYWLQITDVNHCSVRDSIQVDTKKCLDGFFMPSAFSPNGDGKNDVLKPVLNGDVRRIRFAVYDRWGQILFETTERNKGWDGRLRSGEFASGVLLWTCEYQFQGQPLQVEKGTVVAIR